MTATAAIVLGRRVDVFVIGRGICAGSPDVVVGLFPAGKFELEATAGEHRHGDERFG